MVGDAGERKLQEKCLASLPDSGTNVTLTNAMQQIRILNASSLCRFCSSGAQAMVQNVLDNLGMMVSGRAPKIGHNATPFLKSVLARFAFFRRFGNGAAELVGPKAAESHLSNLQTKGTDKLTIADIEPIVVFAWFLSPEQMLEASHVASDVLANAKATVSLGTEAASSGASSSSTGKAAGSKAKVAKAANSEVDNAMAMFG